MLLRLWDALHSVPQDRQVTWWCLWLGCLIANHVYQWYSGRRRWHDAFDRTWFQTVALIMAWFSFEILPKLR